MTPHPKDLKSDVIEAIRDCEKVSEQEQKQKQRDSKRIHKKMKRKKTRIITGPLSDRTDTNPSSSNLNPSTRPQN